MAKRIPDWVKQDWRERADKHCDECHGDGLITYSARNIDGYTESPCPCVERQMARTR